MTFNTFQIGMNSDAGKFMHYLIFGLLAKFDFPAQPGELKSCGHVTSNHQMSASTFRAFCGLSLSESDKNAGKIFASLDLFLLGLFPELMISYFSFI